MQGDATVQAFGGRYVYKQRNRVTYVTTLRHLQWVCVIGGWCAIVYHSYMIV